MSRNAFRSKGDNARLSRMTEDLKSLVRIGVMVLLTSADSAYSQNWFGAEAVASEVGLAQREYSRAGYAASRGGMARGGDR